MREEFKHDLALELGCSVASLDRMTEYEFRKWVAYASKRLLPTRRMEAYLAQVCSTIAQSVGVKDATLSTYLLKLDHPKPQQEKAPGAEAAIIGAIAGRKVIKLGQGRK